MAKTYFPNLAGVEGCDDQVIGELKRAGIMHFRLPATIKGEVPTKIMGDVCMWGFDRAWYYWICTGPGIPPDIAEQLHATHGEVVRVDGHCGCPSPTEWFKGFAVGLYHVDTEEGLKALADTLKSIYKGG